MDEETRQLHFTIAAQKRQIQILKLDIEAANKTIRQLENQIEKLKGTVVHNTFYTL